MKRGMSGPLLCFSSLASPTLEETQELVHVGKSLLSFLGFPKILPKGAEQG